MSKLWQQEFSWNVYRSVWPQAANWIIIGTLADWLASVDDFGNLFPVDYVPTRRA